MGTKNEDAELEREQRLVKALTDAMQSKFSEMHLVSEAERREHADDHKFISELKEAHAQQKKFRTSIIEHVLKGAALGIVIFVGVAVWNLIKLNVKA